MRNTAHEEEYRGCKIILEYCQDIDSPREDDNLGTMACWHRRYNLGDVQPNEDAGEYLFDLARQAVSVRYPEALLEKNRDAILAKHYVILPLYLYDHSGITMSTGAFSCPWDSGQVGIIHCSLDQARKNWMLPKDAPKDAGWDYMLDEWYDKAGKYIGEEQKKLPPEQRIKVSLRDAVARSLKGEVQTYDDFLTGQVVGYIAEDPDGEEISSCWGYFPDHDVPCSKEWDYPISEAKSAIDSWCDKQATESAEAQHWAERDVITPSP